VRGAVQGGRITLKLNVEVQGTALEVTYAGAVESSDAMKGTVDIGGQATGSFTAKRQ